MKLSFISVQRIALGFVLFVLLLLGGLWWELRDLPDVQTIKQEGLRLNHWTQLFARDGTAILSNGKFLHKQVSLSRISPNVVKALLATEDRRFYHHRGVDPFSIFRAVWVNLTQHRLAEGGSTISQQLARNLFLSNHRSLKRKLREAVLAYRMEQELSKDEILELYLNTLFLGEGAYGIQAASEIYFNKNPKELTIPEAALLAGLPQAPTQYSPFQHADMALRRRNEVLQNLKEVSVITQQDCERYQKMPLGVVAQNGMASGNRAPFFNQWLMTQILKKLDMDEQTFWQSGLKVLTTLDLQAQQAAEKAVQRFSGNHEAAMVSLNPQTGAILAYVGGKDFSQSQFDRVTQARRSPGSLFKVFTYVTALDRGNNGKGFLPQRVYLDEPLTMGEWSPQNYDRKHYGYMNLAMAFAKSNNIVAVKLLKDVGPEAAIHYAHNMGIESPLEANLSITLGGAGITVLEATSAVGTLANVGVHRFPYAIERIVDASGKLLFSHEDIADGLQAPQSVLSAQTVDTMIAMMQGVVRVGTAQAAALPGFDVAGKTGTSDEHRDAWFVGFTPGVVTGVWLGNDNNTPMGHISGGSLPAMIWHAMMQSFLASNPPEAANRKFELAEALPISPEDFLRCDLKQLAPGERASASLPSEVVPLPEMPSDAPTTTPNSVPTEDAAGVAGTGTGATEASPVEEGMRPPVTTGPVPPSAGEAVPTN